MKMLNKLALVSAVSMISAGAFAMEAMDDESMASATGQDGITILIAPATKTTAEVTAWNVSAATRTAIDVNANTVFKGLSITQVVIHDDDGLAAAAPGGTATTVNSGALVIGDGTLGGSTAVIADDATPIIINLDMVGNIAGGAGDAPMLNIAITTPKMAIKLGDIFIANSNASEALFDADGVAAPGNLTQLDGTTNSGAVKIISGFEIVMGGATTVIQLGNEAQGAMIRANTSIIGGLTINNFALIDANGVGAPADVGSIQVGSLVMKDNGGANLTVDARMNVSGGVVGPIGEGLYITMAQFGHATNGADLALNNVALGAAGTTNILGDIQILGLNIAGTTMVIRGH